MPVHGTEDLPEQTSALPGVLRHKLETAGWKIGRVWEGPAYTFAEIPPMPEGCVVLDSSSAGLLRKHFDDIIPELDAIYPCVAIVIDGDAVSLCRTVRRSRLAAEAGVNTAEGRRRRGLASQVVANWASLVHRLGLLPMYSTSWDNMASRALAAKLGLVQYGTDFSLSEKYPL